MIYALLITVLLDIVRAQMGRVFSHVGVSTCSTPLLPDFYLFSRSFLLVSLIRKDARGEGEIERAMSWRNPLAYELNETRYDRRKLFVFHFYKLHFYMPQSVINTTLINKINKNVTIVACCNTKLYSTHG